MKYILTQNILNEGNILNAKGRKGDKVEMTGSDDITATVRHLITNETFNVPLADLKVAG